MRDKKNPKLFNFYVNSVLKYMGFYRTVTLLRHAIKFDLCQI